MGALDLFGRWRIFYNTASEKFLVDKSEMASLGQHRLLGATAIIPMTQRVRVGKVPALGTTQNDEAGLLRWK